MTPARGEPSPNKGQKFPPEVLTPEDVRALLAQCSLRAPTGVRNRALITLLYRSGLRVSEALAIRPADIDMAAHSIRLLDTKSGRAQTRGFHPSADDALLRWLDTRKGLHLRNGKLFCTLAGEPVSDVYVRTMLRRIALKAGIEKRVHPHALRHTFAAELEAQGVPVTTISKLLGHAGMAVTAKYLDHLTNAQAVSALAEVDLPGVTGARLPEEIPGLPAEVAEGLADLRGRLASLEDSAAEDRRTAEKARQEAEKARMREREAKEAARAARRDAQKARAEALKAEMAKAALEYVAGTDEAEVAAPIIRALPVSMLKLRAAPYNCLLREGVETIGEQLQCSAEDLAGMRDMGTAAVDEIRDKLAENGLALREDPAGENEDPAQPPTEEK